jgi:hypothetical protein
MSRHSSDDSFAREPKGQQSFVDHVGTIKQRDTLSTGFMGLIKDTRMCVVFTSPHWRASLADLDTLAFAGWALPPWPRSAASSSATTREVSSLCGRAYLTELTTCAPSCPVVGNVLVLESFGAEFPHIYMNASVKVSTVYSSL